MSSAVEQITSVIPIAVASGVTLKMTQAALGTTGQRVRKKEKRLQKRIRRNIYGHPGNFANVGL